MTKRDPVCGMEITAVNPVDHSDYQGDTYYFCSKYCKSKFDRDPEHYVKQSRDEGERQGYERSMG